ncbi:hypothetical protein DYB36_013613 [Aphanomyces astaci]|uniref:Bax inhibitor 1 n=1 Tax=Aphanomyces astaci TaxID=112090 RepID=A0A397BYV8_APHAT|nr:hypothetical protein DYB36_013613 [Aphanomyces astaci]
MAISRLGVIGLLLYLCSIDRNDTPKCISVLYAIAFATGVNIGPLVSVVHCINPIWSPRPFLGTSVVFGCFTCSALLEKRRSYFFLYSAMSSAILCLSLVQLVSIVAPSSAMYKMELYVVLLIFSGCVLLDTEKIIEKASLGDRDFVRHSLCLFLDFVAFFVRLLIKNPGKKGGSRKLR